MLDSFEHILNLAIAFALAPFQFIEPVNNFFMRGQQLTEAAEPPHDCHVYLNRPFDCATRSTTSQCPTQISIEHYLMAAYDQDSAFN